MTFDGYGRLQTKHAPEQNSGTATTYSYNNDDTTNSVTDARGASATYSYNNRHQVTSVSYSAPAGITPTSNVTYGYDAVGNRTSTTDGTGSCTYNYDQLSRMTSETHTFNGLAGSYTLSYSYNLGGELTSLAEPSQFGAVVNYTHDSAGRLTDVTGSRGISAQLLSGIQYRAWGAMKHASYGDGPQLNVTYNARLQVARYEINNVYLSYLIYPGYFTIGSENQYYADGRLRYARDLQDGNFDRAYDYDQAGRLKEAYSGREARGLPPLSNPDNPYRQSYSYDVWNNMGRTGKHWSAPVSDTPTYTNNRRPDWSYDANGEVTSRDYGNRNHSYEAAGEQSGFNEQETTLLGNGHWIWHHYTIDQTYDGNGRAAKRVETRHSEDENASPIEDYTETSYNLRSSVLGGALIAKIDSPGSREGHIYAGGELLADYQYTGSYTFTSLRHRNPTTGNWVKNAVRTELDPLGADVSVTNPYVYNLSYSDIMGSDNLYYQRGNALDIRGGCQLDSMPIPCSLLNEAMASETDSVEVEYTDIPAKDNNGVRITKRRPLIKPAPGIIGIQVPDVDGESWYLALFNLPQDTKPHWDFGSNERQIANLAVNDALAILNKNLECRDFFNTGQFFSGDNPEDVLQEIRDRGNIVRGDPDAEKPPTAMTFPAAVERSTITLYNPFFLKTVGGTRNEFGRNSLSEGQARALVILHELAHAVWRNFHPFFMSSHELDRQIYDKCFHGGQSPLPKGIAE